jgi:hypothetical protein
MRLFKRIMLLILILTVVFQFVQPNKNQSEGPQPGDIGNVYAIPAEVHGILKHKCYDCHSNNTQYPWYFNIQPIGWWLAAHIHEGKQELNFSEFKSYPPKKAAHKLEEIGEVIEDGSMPLKAYTTFHEGAELTAADKTAINDWLKNLPGPQ